MELKRSHERHHLEVGARVWNSHVQDRAELKAYVPLAMYGLGRIGRGPAA